MAVGVLQGRALVWQGREGRGCDGPPGAPASPEVPALACGHPQVGAPAAGLARVLAPLPGRETIAPPRRVRGIAGASMEQAPPLAQPCGAVVPFLIAPAPGVLRRLPRLAQRGLSACVAPQEGGQTVRVPGLDLGRLRPEAVVGDDARERGMLLAPLGHQALGGMPFPLVWGRPVVPHARCRPPGQAGPQVRLHPRGPHPRMTRGERPLAVDGRQTRGPVHGLGGNLLWGLQGPEGMSLTKRQRCQRLAALEWSPEARAHRTEPLRGAGLTSRAQVCVARHTRAPVDGVPMALGALLGTGEERGRLEGKPGQGGHARRGEGHLGRVQTVSGQAGHATAHPVQARLGRERLPDTRPHAGQKKPRHENSHIVLVRGSFRINVDARPGQLTR